MIYKGRDAKIGGGEYLRSPRRIWESRAPCALDLQVAGCRHSLGGHHPIDLPASLQRSELVLVAVLQYHVFTLQRMYH